MFTKIEETPLEYEVGDQRLVEATQLNERANILMDAATTIILADLENLDNNNQ